MGTDDRVDQDMFFGYGTWDRLEPRARSDHYDWGLEARTADPLWFLSRQWQVGEFQAEDTGSPICARLTYGTQRITKLRLGKAETSEEIPEKAPPLEMLVEQERSPFNWRRRIQMGQHFERLVWEQVPIDVAEPVKRQLQEFLVSLRTTEFPVKRPTDIEHADQDPSTRQFLTFMGGRVIDGALLWKNMRNNSFPDMPDTVRDFFELAMKEFQVWHEAVYPEQKSAQTAWQPESLDYRFELEASDNPSQEPTRLVASDYRNGELDWYTFSIAQDKWNSPTEPRTKIFTPTQLSFPGMPHSRWWEFEDHALDFGQLEAGLTDLGRLMLIRFGLLYSDDWFQVPLDVPVSSLTRIAKLEVLDVFGHPTTIDPGTTSDANPLKRFHLYSLDHLKPEGQFGQFLFIPPAVPYRDESPPLEEVRFLRDEGANMVWGVEHTVQNDRGEAVDGFERQQERKIKDENIRQEGVHPNYRLASVVPDNWIPFIPRQIQQGQRSIKLHRAIMIRNERVGVPEEIQSMTTILNHQNPQDLTSEPITHLNEEAVFRVGVKVQVTKQRVRWVDGKTYVWQGRKVVTGRGEGSSGLKFDFILPD